MDIIEAFRNYLRYLLQNQSVNAFSQKVNVSQGYLSDFLNPKNPKKGERLSLKVVQRIAQNGFDQSAWEMLRDAEEFSKKKLCLSR